MIAALSVATLALAFVTDAQMTSCRKGSVYQFLHICHLAETAHDAASNDMEKPRARHRRTVHPAKENTTGR